MFFLLWPTTQTTELDLDGVNHHAKYLCRRSFHLKVVTHTHNWPVTNCSTLTTTLSVYMTNNKNSRLHRYIQTMQRSVSIEDSVKVIYAGWLIDNTSKTRQVMTIWCLTTAVLVLFISEKQIQGTQLHHSKYILRVPNVKKRSWVTPITTLLGVICYQLATNCHSYLRTKS